MTRRLAAPLLAGLVTLALATSVLAHASLVSSDPPASGTLMTTPYELSAVFDEELTANGSSIVVDNQSGTQVASGTVGSDPHTMRAELPELPAGVYVVRWTAVTADDLAVERGTYTFNVGSYPVPSPAATQPPTGGATGSSNDVLIAIGLATVLVLAVVAFIFVRGHR